MESTLSFFVMKSAPQINFALPFALDANCQYESVVVLYFSKYKHNI